jgi:hypothetical protein
MAAIFLDFQKVFDTVWHLGLLYKLYKLKFSVRVSAKGEMSVPKDIKTGVPQGSVLSPTLYSLIRP